MFEGIRDRNIWLYFPIVYRIKKYPISETKWNMTGHFVGKGKYLCKGRKNSFNSFLRYSYFQLTTSLYINPQVVYITQHIHTDLELILKRILKIMISKGVAGTKNSFQFLILKSWRKAYCILTFIDIVFAPAIYFLCIYS